MPKLFWNSQTHTYTFCSQWQLPPPPPMKPYIITLFSKVGMLVHTFTRHQCSHRQKKVMSFLLHVCCGWSYLSPACLMSQYHFVACRAWWQHPQCCWLEQSAWRSPMPRWTRRASATSTTSCPPCEKTGGWRKSAPTLSVTSAIDPVCLSKDTWGESCLVPFNFLHQIQWVITLSWESV